MANVTADETPRERKERRERKKEKRQRERKGKSTSANGSISKVAPRKSCPHAKRRLPRLLLRDLDANLMVTSRRCSIQIGHTGGDSSYLNEERSCIFFPFKRRLLVKNRAAFVDFVADF